MDEIDEQRRRAARELFVSIGRQTRREWTSARLTWSEIGGRTWAHLEVDGPDGRLPARQVFSSVDAELRRLRRLSATPEDGAWLTAVLTVSRDGRFGTTTEHDERPAWTLPSDPAARTDDDLLDEDLLDDHFVDDLERHPRPAARVPLWWPSPRPAEEASAEEWVPRAHRGPDARDVVVRLAARGRHREHGVPGAVLALTDGDTGWQVHPTPEGFELSALERGRSRTVASAGRVDLLLRVLAWELRVAVRAAQGLPRVPVGSDLGTVPPDVVLTTTPDGDRGPSVEVAWQDATATEAGTDAGPERVRFVGGSALRTAVGFSWVCRRSAVDIGQRVLDPASGPGAVDSSVAP